MGHPTTFRYRNWIRWGPCIFYALLPLFLKLDYQREFLSGIVDELLWLCFVALYTGSWLFLLSMRIKVFGDRLEKETIFRKTNIRFEHVETFEIQGDEENNLFTYIRGNGKKISYDSYLDGYSELNSILRRRCPNAEVTID